MRMLAACIHLQVAHLRSPQTRAGQHAFHGFLDNEFGIFFEIFGRRGQPNASRIARMTDILLVRELLPGQSHLLGVDDDDIVTAVNVRSETRLVFSAQDFGYLGGKTSQYRVRCVDQNPFLGDGRSVGGDCLVA